MSEGRLHTAASADRTSRSADIATNSHIPSHRERTDSILAVQHDDEVRDIGTNLQPPTNATSRDAGWGGPGAVGQARDDEARACLPGEHKARLEHGEYSEA